MKLNKAIFIDKDGTLIPDIPYNVDPAKIKLFDGVATRLRRLKELGFLLVVVSNQSGVAHGYFHEAALSIVEHKLQLELQSEGIQFDAFYYCPHHPAGSVAAFAFDCECRKPKPGMLLRAAAHFEIDLAQSWMVGDILNDIEAGNKVNCRTILINNGNETQWKINIDRLPTCVVSNINDGLNYIADQTNVVV